MMCLPLTSAHSDHDPFPDVTFKVFSDFVQNQFSSKVSLATVLTLVFTMTSNPDLLNLHARQQHPKAQGELQQSTSGWIKALARALEHRLGKSTNSLFQHKEEKSMLTEDQVTTSIGIKLDGLSKILNLHPYNKQGQFIGKLKSISEQEIEAVHIICPTSVECKLKSCHSRAIRNQTRHRDVPKVTLIKGTKIYDNVPVLSGQCSECQTGYYADHERSRNADDTWTKVYLNSANYLKVGQNIWVDRMFSGAVLNGFYNFHASASAFAEFWNASFWSEQMTCSRKVSRRQVWQAFVQESVRRVASVSDYNLELADRLPIDEVTKQAFQVLGEDGIIRSAEGHSCSECTHKHKSEADRIPEVHDPAALVGVDENHIVPALVNEDDNNVDVEDEERTDSGDEAMDVDEPSGPPSDPVHQMVTEYSDVTMVVLDGIVFGPKHCAFENCTEDLCNYKNGVFCAEHEAIRGHLCHVQGCEDLKAAGIQTCNQHRERWHSHVVRFGRSTLLGVRRMLRRSEEESLPWLPAPRRNIQPHDEPAPAPAAGPQSKTYFVAPHFYCVETVTATCGVVHGWAKFAKAESPTNILNFLEKVYPTESSRPDYICIDKACLVLRHAVASGKWDVWKKTTRFIVDSYHYINHRTSDYLCRKYCNPAPLNGSAPNLVVVENDKFGRPHYKRAFNTQVYFHSI
jgi:hypothetical protein